ncbi:MAG TPA: glycosyltransferase family 2 protein [Cyclobacteriaceae bacterium]|nr:glycosyltransferase family 2 protein [Cyclobacteriaceae bacterium]
MEQKPRVSIIFVNYNGKAHFDLFIKSLSTQTYQDFELIMVDNDSSDDSVEYVRKNFPEVKVVEATQNLGFGAGNNLGVKYSRGELIVFTNYDVEFDGDWLANMVATANESEIVGLVAPKIMYFDKRDVVQTCGLTFQYTGHAFSRGLGEPSENYAQREAIGSVTGCAFLIKRSVIDRIGAFDEEFHKFGDFFFSSLEDVDLSWRSQLAGYQVIFEPTAIMYHKYEQKPLTPLRYYYLECGRYYSILKNYSLFSLILLSPAFLLSEILGLGYVSLKGRDYFTAKMRMYAWLLKKSTTVSVARKRTQALRSSSDFLILGRFEAKTEARHIGLPKIVKNWIEGFVNSLFCLHQRIVLRILDAFAKY